MKKKKIIKLIFVTGGPCSGKTTAINRSREYFIKRGWTVLVVHEAATLFLTTGMQISFAKKAAAGHLTGDEFQELLLRYQHMIQNIYLDAGRLINADKILILCDRSIIDSQAYIGEKKFKKLLQQFSLTKFGLLHYDDPSVIHMVTAANGAEHAYTLANNKARSEPPALARKLDTALFRAYNGVGHKSTILNTTDNFDDKVKEFVRRVAAVLGEPVPLENERKFLVKLSSLPNVLKETSAFKCIIKQDYLRSKRNIAERVRQRGSGDEWVYYHTVKKRISDTTNTEMEDAIEYPLFSELLFRKDPALRQINKDRFCFDHEYQYLEFDRFKNHTHSFDKKKHGILEVEFTEHNTEELIIPPYIDVVEEVTGNLLFDNKEIARM